MRGKFPLTMSPLSSSVHLHSQVKLLYRVVPMNGIGERDMWALGVRQTQLFNKLPNLSRPHSSIK